MRIRQEIVLGMAGVKLLKQLGYKPICESVWPKYDEEKTVEQEKEIGVQVNGKLRASIKIAIDEDKDSIEKKALESENVKKFTEGHEIVKVIVVPGRIVNIVIK